MLKQTATNLFLQALTLASKTILLLVLARYLSVAEVGIFGILSITLSLGIHFVGLDFYGFNTREILARPGEASRLIRDQAVFHLLSYLLVLPALLLVFAFEALPWSLLVVFVGLLVVEHLAQEMQRLLFTLSRPIQAALTLFLRGGMWVYALLVLFLLEPQSRTIGTVCIVWVAGSTTAVLFAGFCLRNLDWQAGIRSPVDWAWVQKGLLVAMPLLSSTLVFRALLAVDRYALQHFWGPEAVGIYTFYATIRNAIQGFLEAAVLFVLRPKVIAAHEQGDVEGFRREISRLTWATLALVGLLSLAAFIAIDPVLKLVGTKAYAEHKELLRPILLMTFIFALAEIPHTVLYARHQDRALVATSFLGLIAAIVFSLILVPNHGLMGAAFATLLAGLTILVAKQWIVQRSP
jgi:O-antigen/teichoic acid export membrane protein